MTMIDGYVEQLRPYVQSVGLTAQTYAERMCARLDQIYEAVKENDVWVSSGLELFYQPAVQASLRVTTLGTDDMWILTSISRGSTVNPGYVRLDDRPIFILAAGQATNGATPIYIPGPGELSVDTDVTATSVAAQFYRFTRRASNATNRLGFGNPLPEASRKGITPTHRHAGSM